MLEYHEYHSVDLNKIAKRLIGTKEARLADKYWANYDELHILDKNEWNKDRKSETKPKRKQMIPYKEKRDHSRLIQSRLCNLQ